MTEPVVDATSVYVGRNAAATPVVAAETLVTALAADLQQWATTWQVTLPAAITADLALAASTLFIPTGGTIVALNTADGSTKWSHQLSGSAVTGRPMVIGSTLYVGSTDGTLYALDTATGDEQWRVDTGSAIVTGLVNEDSVLYFATAGDGAGTGPAFLAVDTNSQGNDVLAYPVPDADTILFAQGGVTNGVVYFYGAQNVYAVNMSNVIREFAVTSKLIVENYDTSTSTPTGSDTSYRVTLSIRDENGFARLAAARQAVVVRHPVRGQPGQPGHPVPGRPGLDADRRLRQPHAGGQRLRRRHAHRHAERRLPAAVRLGKLHVRGRGHRHLPRPRVAGHPGQRAGLQRFSQRRPARLPPGQRPSSWTRPPPMTAAR